MANSKETKEATAKKGRGKRNYGEKPVTISTAPNGFKECETNDIIGFNVFGDSATGIYQGLEKIGTGKKQFTVIKLKDAKSGLMRRCSASAHILKQIESNSIKVGTELLIQFIDLKQLSGNRTLKIFKVYYK